MDTEKTVNGAGESSPAPDGSALRQTIYDHGGSRIWLEKPNGRRELLADTYTTADFAKVVRAFTEEWLRQNASLKRPARSDDRSKGDGSALRDCHDCGANPGQPHRPGCDTEQCSVCGGQRIQCLCKGHDRAFARWTGIWPGSAESAALGIDLNEFHRRGLHRVFFVKPKKKDTRNAN